MWVRVLIAGLIFSCLGLVLPGCGGRIGSVSPSPGPIAVIVVSPQSGTAPLAVTADSSGSYETGGVIASRTIDFGDGTAAATTTSVTHTYSNAGVFMVTLMVKDSANETATVSKTVSVTSPASASGARGYVTTPGELKMIAGKAAQGIEDRKSVV